MYKLNWFKKYMGLSTLIVQWWIQFKQVSDFDSNRISLLWTCYNIYKFLGSLPSKFCTISECWQTLSGLNNVDNNVFLRLLVKNSKWSLHVYIWRELENDTGCEQFFSEIFFSVTLALDFSLLATHSIKVIHSGW